MSGAVRLLHALRCCDPTNGLAGLLAGVIWIACGPNVFAEPPEESEPESVELTDRLPFGREPIDYFSSKVDDAVAALGKRLAAGETGLASNDSHGYLESVLAELHVPIESQVLVYSKTARSPKLVSPDTPRAVYFNDEVSVAWIPEARELELSAIDPVKGVNFYTLSQPLESDSKFDGVTESQVFTRRDRCLACHAGRSSLEVPGLLLRAFQTDEHGNPQIGFSRVTHEMDYQKRWGGWFVTDTPVGMIHRGNLTSKKDNELDRETPGFRARLADLSGLPIAGVYPSDHSDIVAHMVLAHQAHGTNLLVRAGMEARLSRRSDVEERLVRYLTFADEAPLLVDAEEAAMTIKESPYAQWFSRQGPRDTAGRSLRDFVLTDRLFKYRLSYLIQTRLFDSLPEGCRNRVLKRLWKGLTGRKPNEKFEHFHADERSGIIAIVRETVPNLPECWY